MFLDLQQLIPAVWCDSYLEADSEDGADLHYRATMRYYNNWPIRRFTQRMRSYRENTRYGPMVPPIANPDRRKR